MSNTIRIKADDFTQLKSRMSLLHVLETAMGVLQTFSVDDIGADSLGVEVGYTLNPGRLIQRHRPAAKSYAVLKMLDELPPETSSVFGTTAPVLCIFV